MLAVRERQVRGKRVRLLCGRDDDRVEATRVVEDLSKIVEAFRLRVPLRRFIDRDVVDVAKNDDVLVVLDIGQGVKLEERLEDFPSEELIAKLLLVSG